MDWSLMGVPLPGGEGGGGPAPTPAPPDKSPRGSVNWNQQGQDADASSSMLPSWQFAAICVALAFIVCYLRAHPELIQKLKDKLQGNPEGSWIAVKSEDEDEESVMSGVSGVSGTPARKGAHDGGKGKMRGVDAAAVSRAERESLEAMSAHERARTISKRYRELRNEGRGAAEAMALAEAEVPRRKEVASRPQSEGASQPRPAQQKVVEAPPLAKKAVSEASPPKVPAPKSPSAAPAPTAVTAKVSPPPAPAVASAAAASSPAASGTAPRVASEVQARLVEAEAKMTKYRCLRKEGYDEKQSRFLAGLPGEVDDEEFLWTEVQDDIAGSTYFWDGEDEIVKVRPKDNLWRIVVVSEADGGAQATEFEFGKGKWNDCGAVDLPPKPPAPPPAKEAKSSMFGFSAKKGAAAPKAGAKASAGKAASPAKAGGKATPTKATPSKGGKLLGRMSKSEPRVASNPLASGDGDDDDGFETATAASGESSKKSAAFLAKPGLTVAEKKAAKARKDVVDRNAKHEAEARAAQAKAKAAGSGVADDDERTY